MAHRPPGDSSLSFTPRTELPLVGRVADLAALRLALDDAVDGRGSTVLLEGDSGIGKTRLVQSLAREAATRGMLVAAGAAYAVEAGIPFGMISDALVSPLRALPPATLSVLARGAEHELGTVLHGLSSSREASQPSRSSEADNKARLFWTFAQFLERFAARQPLLLVFENAQWSDPSSLELLHFAARNLRNAPCLIIITYADDEQVLPTHLRAATRSMVARGDATVRRLPPLTRHDVADIAYRLFALPEPSLSALADQLHERARGNPLFVDQLLRHLVESRSLTFDGSRWSLGNVADLGLPATIREALRERLGEIEPGARRVAEAAAVIGTRASLPLLQEVAGMEARGFADAIDVLCARRVLREFGEGVTPQYEFVHPMMQLTVLGWITAARRRALHLATAGALEHALGDAAHEHAQEIARHLVEGHALGGDARALHFIAAAGREALDRHADAEALRLLTDALALADRLPPGERSYATYLPLLENLARARQRCGDRDGAITVWRQALVLATENGDLVAQALILRRLGLAFALAGRPADGLALLQEAEDVARKGGRLDLAIRARVSRGMQLQSLGRLDEGKSLLEEILPTAVATGDPTLLARVHRALMQLYGWTGPAAVAREHGEAALRYASASGERELTWWAHWGMAVIAGLGGNSQLVAVHRREAESIADELRSPQLQLSVAEIAVEYASAIGEWGDGLARAERAIPLARAIAPATILPRLLVWTGLILLERDEVARGRELIEEAWRLTSAEQVADAVHAGLSTVAGEVHNVILAHTGMAAYALCQGEWERALALGQRGLAIADRYGYVVWALHRLLPIILEAALWLQRFDLALAIGGRFREESQRLGHQLGIAWADAADALYHKLVHRRAAAMDELLEAAERLDAIPFPFHAARLRHRIGQLMAGEGDADGARRELRRAHDVFVQLGAERELRATRSEMRTLGMRLPPRVALDGAYSLTGRELDIARLVAQRLTNKEIATRLDISARTVSTHLSNMFGKLDVDSRGALVDLLRRQPGFLDESALSR